MILIFASFSQQCKHCQYISIAIFLNFAINNRLWTFKVRKSQASYTQIFYFVLFCKSMYEYLKYFLEDKQANFVPQSRVF